MKFYLYVIKRLFIALIISLAVSSIVTSTTNAAYGDPATIDIVPVEVSSTGKYVYRIKGHLQDFPSDGTDATIYIKVNGEVVYEQHLYTGYDDDVGTVELGPVPPTPNLPMPIDISFDYLAELNIDDIASIEVFQDGYDLGTGLADKTIMSRSVNFVRSNAYLQGVHDGTLNPDGSVVVDSDGDGVPDHAGAGIEDSDPVPGPSLTATCSDWSTVKDIETIGQCFADWGALANRFMIGIAVIASLFMIPWIGYLWASGNPGNVEKGWELFNSWFWGLLLLLMSGFIISIFGKDLFGVS